MQQIRQAGTRQLEDLSRKSQAALQELERCVHVLVVVDVTEHLHSKANSRRRAANTVRRVRQALEAFFQEDA